MGLVEEACHNYVVTINESNKTKGKHMHTRMQKNQTTLCLL